MHDERKKDEFTASAKEAEEQAAKAKDDLTKASWLRIAVGYRELVARQGTRF
jgi:hypothetical protein